MNCYQSILLRLEWMKKWYIHVDVHRKLQKKLHEKSTRWILDVFDHGIYPKLTKRNENLQSKFTEQSFECIGIPLSFTQT